MRQSGAEQFGGFDAPSKQLLSIGQLRFIDSRAIWLALDENHEDSRRIRRPDPIRLEPVNDQELDLFQRQLFYWLLIRHGPYIFTQETQFEQGIPTGFRVRN